MHPNPQYTDTPAKPNNPRLNGGIIQGYPWIVAYPRQNFKLGSKVTLDSLTNEPVPILILGQIFRKEWYTGLTNPPRASAQMCTPVYEYHHMCTPILYLNTTTPSLVTYPSGLAEGSRYQLILSRYSGCSAQSSTLLINITGTG